MVEININTFDYLRGDYNNWILPNDYHCLYILENGIDAYIGETKDVIMRSKQHKQKNDLCYKYTFKRIHIITSDKFEETPAKHFETLLIRLMIADGKFNVINVKNKEWQHYQRKNEFELYFDQLWIKLEEKALVKHKNFQTILNLSEYKFSPNIMLTKLQYETLASIIHTIDSQETRPHKKGFLPRPILLSGEAGTGKTVVATSLFYYLKNNKKYENLKIGLVYAVPSTREEIGYAFKNIKGLRKKDVISPISVTKDHYDIIICDEAQRLRRAKNTGKYTSLMKKGNYRLGLDSECDELDWILKNSDCQIFFYDDKQSVCPSDITKESFKSRLYARNRGIRPIALKEQMRIRAGASYVPYIYNVLFQKDISPQIFPDYDFKLFETFEDMFKQIREKESIFGLSRLCAGYAWKWTAKDILNKPDIQLGYTKIFWNRQTSGWLRNENAKKEMGSIYTLPGVDLNYAAVVIGPEIYYDYQESKIKINKSSFFDNKVKRNTFEEELKRFILNTYAVFMTRGILGTYVYVCDDGLREYMKKYIPYV